MRNWLIMCLLKYLSSPSNVKLVRINEFLLEQMWMFGHGSVTAFVLQVFYDRYKVKIKLSCVRKKLLLLVL